MQYAGNANSTVSFQVNPRFEQILISVTHLSKIKGLENNRVWVARLARYDRACSVTRGGGWGWGFTWSTPLDNSVGSGVVWVTGLFSLCNETMTTSAWPSCLRTCGGPVFWPGVGTQVHTHFQDFEPPCSSPQRPCTYPNPDTPGDQEHFPPHQIDDRAPQEFLPPKNLTGLE